MPQDNPRNKVVQAINERLAGHIRMPELPDCTKDTPGWVKATDEIAKRRFNPALPLEHDFHRGRDEAFFAGMVNDDVLLEIVSSRKLLCRSHLRLSQTVMDLTEAGFEDKWIALGREGQEKHLFSAFRVTSQQDEPLMSTFYVGKANCPELCSDVLFRDDGRGFLDLMQQFLLEDNDNPPPEPFTIPNKRFDELIGWEDGDNGKNRQVFLSARRIMRTHHIITVLLLTLEGYEGRPVRAVKFTSEHSKTKPTLQNMRPLMDEILGPKGGKEWQRQETQKRNEMMLFCSACLRPEIKELTGKMSSCSKCREIGREVRYCNRDCQIAAWKTHKLECGKPYDIANVLSSPTCDRPIPAKPSSRLDIPPAAQGHRRNAHIFRLLRYLNEYPEKDYIILPVSGDDLNGISLDTIQGAVTFMIMRNRLLIGKASDDPEKTLEGAMLYVHRVLLNGTSFVTEEDLRAQMQREYGDIWKGVWQEEKKDGAASLKGPQGNVGRAYRDEIDQAIRHLRKVGRFSNLLKGYREGEGGVKVLPLRVGPRKDVMVYVEMPKYLIDAQVGEDVPQVDMKQLAALFKGASFDG